MQAGVDKHESEREVKMKEVITNLQRIFPGVHGRVIDLCKPTQRKYETAVSVVLGRNTEAIVVDLERTAIDCIEVAFLSCLVLRGFVNRNSLVPENKSCWNSYFHSSGRDPTQAHQ